MKLQANLSYIAYIFETFNDVDLNKAGSRRRNKALQSQDFDSTQKPVIIILLLYRYNAKFN